MSEKVPHIWSKDALLNKASRYISEMQSYESTKWQHAFLSSLVLEFLLRACLSNISPALLASGKEWQNIYFALGGTPIKQKFQPKSEDIAAVLSKIKDIYPDFTDEMNNFCASHIGMRNGELHSGDLPFDALVSTSWKPLFYETIDFILKSLSINLSVFLGEKEAESALTMIASRKDQAAKDVKGLIDAHQKVWLAKDQNEKDTLIKQAELFSNRHDGHRVSCPACKSSALVQGSASGPAIQKIDEGTVIERQSMLPTHFECTACGLKISGFSKLEVCGLGNEYTATSYYDAAEFFGFQSYDDGWAGFDDDNNEP